MHKVTTQKVTYFVSGKSVAIQFGGADYKLPSGKTSIADLAKKLDVSEEQALKLANYAAGKYAAVRPPTKAKERSKPPQKLAWVETQVETIEPPKPKEVPKPKPILEPASVYPTRSRDRVASFEDLEKFN